MTFGQPRWSNHYWHTDFVENVEEKQTNKKTYNLLSCKKCRPKGKKKKKQLSTQQFQTTVQYLYKLIFLKDKIVLNWINTRLLLWRAEWPKYRKLRCFFRYVQYVTSSKEGDFLQLFLFQLQLKVVVFFLKSDLFYRKWLFILLLSVTWRCSWMSAVNSLLKTQKSESSRAGCGSSFTFTFTPFQKRKKMLLRVLSTCCIFFLCQGNSFYCLTYMYTYFFF